MFCLLTNKQASIARWFGVKRQLEKAQTSMHSAIITDTLLHQRPRYLLSKCTMLPFMTKRLFIILLSRLVKADPCRKSRREAFSHRGLNDIVKRKRPRNAVEVTNNKGGTTTSVDDVYDVLGYQPKSENFQ